MSILELILTVDLFVLVVTTAIDLTKENDAYKLSALLLDVSMILIVLSLFAIV